MRRLQRYFLLLGLALLLAAGLLVWQGDRLLQGVLRPALVRAVAAGVGGEASLGRLELGWNRLALIDLQLRKPETFELALQRGEASWTFASLLRRRLVTLDLVAPRLTLQKTTKTEEPVKPLPPGSGFPFDYLRIREGELSIPLGPGELALRELGLELADGAPPTLVLQGVAGREAVPLDLAGTLAWNQGFELQLEQLKWDGAERLSTPLTLNFDRERSLQGRGALIIDTLDGPTLERWLRALGGDALWPEGLVLELEGLKLEAEVNPERLSARLQMAAGSAQTADWNIPWAELELSLGGTPESWQGKGTAQLAERFPLQLSALKEEGRISAQGRLEHLGGQPGEGATLQASATQGAGGWQGELSVDRLRSRELVAVLRTIGLKSPFPKNLVFDLTEPRLEWKQQARSRELELSLPSGQVQGEGWKLPLSAAQLQVSETDGVWLAEGALRLAGAATRFSGGWQDGIGHGSLNLVSLRAAKLLRDLGLGDWPLAGGFELNLDGQLQEEVLTVDSRLRGRPQAPLPATAKLDLAAMDLTARLQKTAEGLGITGALAVGGQPVLQAAGDTQQLRLTLQPSRWQTLEQLLPPATRPALLQGAEGLSAEVLVAPSEGGWQAQGSGQAAALRLQPATLEGLSWSGTLTSTGDRLRLRQGRLTARLQSSLGQVEQLQLAADAELEGSDYRLQLQNLTVDGVELMAADGLSGLTGGHLSGTATFSGRRSGKDVAVQAELQGGVKELLAGSFYGDFSGLETRLKLTGAFAPEARRLQAQRLELELGELARGSFQGTLAAGEGQLKGRIDLPELSALDGQLLPALVAAYPALAGLGLEGRLQLEGSGRWADKDWQLQGEAQPQNLNLRWPGPRLEIDGLSGTLPFELGPPAGEIITATTAGGLALNRLQAGPLSMAASQLALRVGRNRLQLDSPLLFNLAGGELRLAGLAIGRNPSGLELAAEVRVGEVDLQRLTEEMKLPSMQGRLSANLGSISYADDQLRSAGTAGINAFSGGILIKNIRLQSPFSSYRTLEADIDFEAINLFELTQTFEFGEMNGLADGHIHDLRLFGATPSAFEAAFSTRLAGRRNISVKALKNLSILSQGGLQAALSRGVYRFIDFYRYRRIGFVCSLENDLFQLRGTAREGSDKYLIYGGLMPPKIDIVAPSRNISFKEMVKRLGRLDRKTGGG